MRKNNIPTLEKLFIYMTDQCNQYCRHCWVKGGPNNSLMVDSKRIIDQIDKAMRVGLKIVKVTGGEPLLAKEELFKVLEHSYNNNLETRLETNATLINESDAARLAKIGIEVYVSLDGCTPNSHDSFRRMEGSFKATLKGLKNLLMKNVSVNIISCIHEKNFNEIERIYDFCTTNDVSSLKFNFPSLYGRAKELQIGSELFSIKKIIKTTHYIETNF